MSELDEKLNAILSDPDSMAQVMQLAQQLSDTFGNAAGASPPPPPPSSAAPPPNPGAAFGNLDPKLLSKVLPLLQGQSNSQTTQLLYALRPFLKEEKQGKVERAAKLAHLICLGKNFLSEWES